MTEEEPEPLSRDQLLLMRIYDALMALLLEQNPEYARKLYALHAEGGIGNPDVNLDFNNILND